MKLYFVCSEISTYTDTNYCVDKILTTGDEKSRISENCVNLNLASNNIACDPRVKKYADLNGLTEAEVVNRLENPDQSSANVQAARKAIPTPYRTYDTESAQCDDLADQCPQPLPWTSWSCHCPQGSSFQSTDVFVDNDNPDNLPLCECGSEKRRRRYQLCQDGNLADQTTCESVGQSIADIATYNNLCLIESTQHQWWRPYLDDTEIVSSSSQPNWYQLSTWMQSRKDKDSLTKGKLSGFE